MLAFKDAVRQRALIVQGMSPDQALAKIHEEAQSLAWEQEQMRQNSWSRDQQLIWEQEQQQEAQRLVWEQEQQIKWEQEQQVKLEQEQHSTWVYNQAQAQADKIILSAGDLYTSILPHLLVNGVAEAINSSKAKLIFVLNLKIA